MRLLSKLLNKLDIDSTAVDEELLEYPALMLLMKEADRAKKTTDDPIMKKLSDCPVWELPVGSALHLTTAILPIAELVYCPSIVVAITL